MAAPGQCGRRRPAGPIFARRTFPVTGPLNITQDRIYFGEDSPNYSIVDTKQAEIDGPSGGIVRH